MRFRLLFIFYTLTMNTKTAKILYRVATILLAAFILPGLFFMDSEMAKEGMIAVQLNETVWLQQLLGYASPIAILAILIPKIPNWLKEWAYAGLAFVYIGAFRAHFSLWDPVSATAMPIVTFVILMISYFCRHKVIDNK